MGKKVNYIKLTINKLNNKIHYLNLKFSINIKILLFALILTIIPIHLYIYTFFYVSFIYILSQILVVIGIEETLAFNIVVILIQFLYMFLYLKSKSNKIKIFFDIMIFIHLFCAMFFLEFEPLTLIEKKSFLNHIDIYEIPFLIYALIIFTLNKLKIHFKSKFIFN